MDHRLGLFTCLESDRVKRTSVVTRLLQGIVSGYFAQINLGPGLQVRKFVKVVTEKKRLGPY